MAHKLDFTTGKAAFTRVTGSKPAWHKLGGETPVDAPIETWLVNAGLDFEVHPAPSFVKIGEEFKEVANVKHMVRNDSFAVLGTHSDGYRVHQPQQILEHMRDTVLIDERFTMETAGALKGGRVIWGLAKFRDDVMIGGAPHKFHVLMATSFDGSMASVERATSTCVVCDNTLQYSAIDADKQTKISHRTHFNGAASEEAARRFARVVQGFEHLKDMGDALAQIQMSKDDVNAFFRAVLDIPAGATAKEMSGRKLNQYDALCDALKAANRAEASEAQMTRFAALQAVTRYVDHERSTKIGDNGSVEAARMFSAQFGSGNAMKNRAVELLTA